MANSWFVDSDRHDGACRRQKEPIWIDQSTNPEKFVFPTIMQINDDPRNPLFVASGIVLVSHNGVKSNKKEWNHADIQIGISVPAPKDHYLVVDEAVVSVTPQAFSNGDVAKYAGWGVTAATMVKNGGAMVRAHITARDTDGTLDRVGYYATFRGHYLKKASGEHIK